MLIFDEVKTAAKLAWGGAQQHFRVKADIVCLAKAIGGGLPLGGFGARREIMNEIAAFRSFHAGTYASNPLATTTMESFDVEPDWALEPEGRGPLALEADLEVKDLSFVTDSGIHLLDDVNLSLKAGEHLALVGFSGSGKSRLALCIGQLNKYSAGQVLIGNQEVSQLTRQDVVANVGIVAQKPFIFEGSIAENLLYACDALAGEKGSDSSGPPTLDDIIAVLHQTGLFADVLRFGLNTLLTPDRHAELAFPVPGGLKDALTAAIREAYTGTLGPVATGFRIESITIADGLMTVTGRIR